MKYDKLARDKIPEILQNKGIQFTTYVAGDEEYFKKLLEKLKEEMEEFIDNPNEEELADILEVIYAIAGFKNISRKRLEITREKKAKERGAFEKKIILEETKE